jgi:hypothetical protein
MENNIASCRLMSLHSILNEMISLNQIEETEMINILSKAGLTKLPNGEGWIDINGSVYRFKNKN